ncbi:D-amino-acid transaminase [Candidatus Enterococcus clewellii]|uniref:D-alanine aminotransferase n=1 Tax=Candidatus Enterococcus clewellii TaxID=1834193 RepID=A0A242K8Z8_9ENTE|nr:D-amino-acid transaminase [Enterococcus sp. 9E7_DIV0242]OTP17537.1 D-amino-acid transaminase [Enterococcus sp. 9E7_DIV0242]
MKVLWNDQIVDRKEVSIDMEDRGYQYGDGLYEVIRVYNGQFYMADEHMTRLWTGAEKIKLHLPFTKEELLGRLQELTAVEKVTEGKLYLQVTRGIDSPRNHALPDPKKVKAVLTANIIPYDRPVEKQTKGIAVGIVPDTRWLHCDIKSLSLLGNVMALEHARSRGFEDAVQIREGKVTEASAANFWMVKDGTIYTHPDGQLILPGITKLKLLEIAEKLGLPVKEEAFDEAALFTADECFISGSLIEVVPVVKIEEHIVGTGQPGAITMQLHQEYLAEVARHCS